MAGISIETKTAKKGQDGPANWSRWKPVSASLAALSIGCSDNLGTFNSNCNSTPTDGGMACVCNVDGGMVAGMFDNTGSCLPVTPPTASPPTCSSDPNPICTQQSVSKTLTLDGGAASSLVIGDYTVILQSTFQDGNTYGASIALNDFCGNSLGANSISIGLPQTYTQSFGNIVMSVGVNQVATMDPQWALLTATMACPFYVQMDGGFSPPICMNATPASKGGNMYLGSEVDVGGYGFTYTGDSAGFANILVTCNGAPLDTLQCIVGTQTVVPRPMDNGGRTITVSPTNAYLQSADVQIDIQ